MTYGIYTNTCLPYKTPYNTYCYIGHDIQKIHFLLYFTVVSSNLIGQLASRDSEIKHAIFRAVNSASDYIDRRAEYRKLLTATAFRSFE